MLLMCAKINYILCNSYIIVVFIFITKSFVFKLELGICEKMVAEIQFLKLF
jgi:hypothetical protein